jgi:hypothetical protein
VARRLDLQVSVRVVADEATAATSKGERWSAAVYGADRPGLVAREGCMSVPDLTGPFASELPRSGVGLVDRQVATCL